ncbi:MAG: amino acid permease [Candidatus Hydrogenedentes bacterium]|nr:amino acid permease [Candidatus Hydrogenedentota bacterium]
MPAPADTGLTRFITLKSATGLVVANMIGAGIFTTTGYQAADLGHPGLIYALWVIGGVLAFCGALCFAELGAMLPRAGAEYVYIRESYGQALAFVSAFVALTAGFSAPIAAAAKSLVAYMGYLVAPLRDNPSLLGVELVDLCAIAVVWFLVAVHCRGARSGMRFSDAVTVFKVLGIVAIIAAAALWGDGRAANIVEVAAGYREKSPADLASAMATSLIFVTFCYLGWNGSAYVASEMKDPQSTLPKSLLAGTAIVTALYLGLNAVYFYGAGVDGLSGQLNVGTLAAEQLFGPAGVTAVTLILGVSILASASAMTVAGSRVLFAFGQDMRPLHGLAHTSPNGSPWTALLLQGAIVTIVILSGRVDQILVYAGFTLTLFSAIAVSCVIALRIKAPHMPRPFRVWAYPYTPLLFIAVSLWTMIWAFRGRPVESLLALATVLAGGLLFRAVNRRQGH